MSFSQPTKVENPALHFYEWRNGQLSRYDKEKKENIVVKLPYTFGVLDECTTTTGFHEPSNSGIFSNEIKDLSRQTLRVRAFKGGDIATGLYAEIKDKIKANGGRYTRSVYIAEKVGSGYVISNIKFTGAAFSAWLDFTRAHNVEQGIVTLTGSTEGKKGATTYQIPTFEFGELTDEQIATFTTLDKDLQAYLTRYMDTSQLAQDDSVHSDDEFLDSFNTDDGKASPEQLKEYDRLKAEKLGSTKATTTTTPGITSPTPSGEEEPGQEAYNRAAVSEVFDEPGFSDDDIPPEFR